MSLFDSSLIVAGKASAKTAPLAERMRPRTLEEYVGQEHLLGLQASRCDWRLRATTPRR